MPKSAKLKPVNYELIPEKTDREDRPFPYQILDEIREAFHDELEHARIALAWQLRMKADKDGHMVLGKCKKVTDLEKEISKKPYDFIIILNREVWNDVKFTLPMQRALVDHELCHAAQSLDDESGMQKQDERGRKVWRVRKHDIEEFQAIVERHGTYKYDLERFAKALLASKKMPLFPGETTVSISAKDEKGVVHSTGPMPAKAISSLADKTRH